LNGSLFGGDAKDCDRPEWALPPNLETVSTYYETNFAFRRIRALSHKLMHLKVC
jgi:hypothetical protein